MRLWSCLSAAALLSAVSMATAADLPAATPSPGAPTATSTASGAAPDGATAATVSENVAPETSTDLPREKPLQYAVTYRLDARAGAGGEERALSLGGLEAEFVGSYGRKWEFGGQVPLGSQLASSGRKMHFGSLFVVRKWRLGAPTVKLGQFVVPFSNLTSYDVHSRLIQSLYRFSLGRRIDPGVAVEGYLDRETEWQLAVTTGSGPYRFDRDGTPLLTGRVSRNLERDGNAVKLGLSAAGGTLPVYSVRRDPISVEGSPVLGWTSKRRLAIDAEIEGGVDLFRLEGVVGTDAGRAASGAWLGWTRPLDNRNTVEAAAETWQQPAADGRLYAVWLGAEHRLDGSRTTRAALRWSRSREGGRSGSELALMGQYVRQF